MPKLSPITLGLAAALAAQSAYSADPAKIRQLEPQAVDGHVVPGPVIKNPSLGEPDIVVYTAGAHYFKKAVTSTKPRTTSSEHFIPFPGAKTEVVIPAGTNALVNVAFTAESRCNEIHSNSQNWCEVRIMVDGVEASPAASSFPPDTYAFDSTDSGTETTASWESHAMDRHQCVRNQHGNTRKVVPVAVHWKVTNFDGGNAPNFWLDDWSLTVELARGCRRQTLKFDK